MKTGQRNAQIDLEKEDFRQEIDPDLTSKIIEVTAEKAELDHARSHLDKYSVECLVKLS